jgi:RNA polymerase sigma factor (TIGR02999 family)
MPTQRFSEELNLSPQSLGIPNTYLSADAVDELFSATYEDLRRLASAIRKRHSRTPLSPTTLVNEAWIKLAASRKLQFESQLHFRLTAARAMRQILVQAARRKAASKRGGEAIFVTFDDFAAPIRCDRQMLALHESLDELARLSSRQAMVVESRYFGGMEMLEIAELLEISEATVQRDWRAAKAWLVADIERRL